MIDQSFQAVNRYFVLTDRTVHTGYYLKVKIKDYNIMIDGKNVFNQLIKSYVKSYENIGKNYYWLKTWSHNWLLTWLSLFQRKL